MWLYGFSAVHFLPAIIDSLVEKMREPFISKHKPSWGL